MVLPSFQQVHTNGSPYKRKVKTGSVKGIDDKSIQVLAPMYKGSNGIDNLNIILQELFNPPNKKTTMKAKTNKITYRGNT